MAKGPLVIQLKYCPVLPSLNKVDYYYYYYYYYYKRDEPYPERELTKGLTCEQSPVQPNLRASSPIWVTQNRRACSQATYSQTVVKNSLRKILPWRKLLLSKTEPQENMPYTQLS